MLEVNASGLRKHFGRFLGLVSDEPIGIRQAGKLVAVLLSGEEYEHLQQLREAFPFLCSILTRGETRISSSKWAAISPFLSVSIVGAK